MNRITRRILTEKFKREAIKLLTEQGLTLAAASPCPGRRRIKPVEIE